MDGNNKSKSFEENIELITNKYCEELLNEIGQNGLSDKANEGIRMIHHLVQIKENCKKIN